MKILFLCGSLELGRDGVGDYVRRLTGELSVEGHQVTLIALNDGFIETAITGNQLEGLIDIPTLRLSAQDPIAARFTQVEQWIEEYQPEWLSLQFVSFSFHPKGLPYGLGKLLAKIGKGRAWHIMFHELWVGMASNDTLKHKIWGKAQKYIIKDLIAELKPKLMHTQCSLYFKQLQKVGYSIKMLPLFSNIEIEKSSIEHDLIAKYDLDAQSIKFIFFGGLHPEAKLIGLISALRKFYGSRALAFEFLYVGRNGRELEAHMPILKEYSVAYKVFGELAPQDVSYLLKSSTFGVSTGSPEMLEKNGTVAAMLLHSLPVICIGRNLAINGISKIDLMSGTYGLPDIESILSVRPVVKFSHTLLAVAKNYQHDLLQAS